jgi:hypothetical protein
MCNVDSYFKSLLYTITVAASFFVLGAILGQVDMQMCAFYCQNNYQDYWQFPWGRFTNIQAWIQEYSIIVICAFIVMLASYLKGREDAKEK